MSWVVVQSSGWCEARLTHVASSLGMHVKAAHGVSSRCLERWCSARQVQKDKVGIALAHSASWDMSRAGEPLRSVSVSPMHAMQRSQQNKITYPKGFE